MKTNHDNPYLRMRRTKIVATVGPASCTDEMILTLIQKGVNVFRVNFSHGKAEDHIGTMKQIRKISEKAGKLVAILGDLCGPKIRVGLFKDGAVTLKAGTTVRITDDDVEGTDSLIPSQYKGIAKDVKQGESILLDDGNIELEVTAVNGNIIEALVINGGLLKNKKGMNLPGTKMNVAALTEKDKNDALAMIKGEADFIALSFVRTAQDILDLKTHLAMNASEIPIIAKIEKPEALENIESILEAADGIMVARGDLGVEVPQQKVPLIQKELIALANASSKPVIVATQMLESMIENPRPTRAEVTDVAFACFSGADAVMLSAETAVGKYPVETVAMMDSILREIELRQFDEAGFRPEHEHAQKRRDPQTDAISSAAALISRELKVRSIVALTRSGQTARVASSDRPAAPLLALSRSVKTARRLCLMWGVYPQVLDEELRFNEYVRHANNLVLELGLADAGQTIIMLSGLAEKNIGTNAIYLHKVE